MASELRVNNLKDAAGNNSIATSFVAGGSAKCWINFNGTGTIAIRDSFSVTSHSDDGTGLYTINFTSAFGNDDYVGAGLSRNPGVASGGTAQFPSNADSDQTTSSVQHFTINTGGSNADFSHNHVIIHGDLA